MTEAQKAVIQEIAGYFEDRMDIRDGSDGQQLPNTEMSMLIKMKEVGLIND